MRPTPRACVWFLFVAVALLAASSEASGKRKKIVVFVPQKVKHIHHHHVKKVYVKQHKPVEYIEELDEDLHRTGESGDVDGGGGANPEWSGGHHVHYHHQDGDDKVLAEASEDKPTAIEVPDYAWGSKASKATPRPRAFHTHVGRSGEEHGEASDPGVVSDDGWTALASGPSGPSAPSGPERAPTTPRPGGHHHGHHHHHQRHARPEKGALTAEDSTRHQHHHHHPHRKQHKHADEHGVPEDIREWVNSGFEKFRGAAHANDVKPEDDDDHFLDDVRVQVFEDGKEVETTVREAPAPEAKTTAASATTSTTSKPKGDDHHYHYRHSDDGERDEDRHHHRHHHKRHEATPAPHRSQKKTQHHHRKHSTNRRQHQEQPLQGAARVPEQSVTPPRDDHSTPTSWGTWRRR